MKNKNCKLLIETNPPVSPFVKGGEEAEWLPLFQNVVINEVNFTAVKRGEGEIWNTLPFA